MNPGEGTTQKTLSDLNDDCLHRILSFLPGLDKLILGNCLGEGRVLHVVSGNDVFEMKECSRRLTVDETKQILERFGCQIKNISLALPTSFRPSERRRHYELIAAHCRSLEAIRLFDPACESELEIFQKILFTNKSLESISVTAEDETFQNRLLSTVGHVQSIKYLELSSCYVSGAEISQMTNLVALKIHDCCFFREEDFIKLMNGNNLKFLEMSYCPLQTAALQAVFDTQHELEYLNISGIRYSNYASIGQLKKLKELILLFFLEHELISASEGIANLPNLELLEISNIFKSPKVAKMFLSRIVSLKDLKFLYLPQCQLLNDNDLRAIALKTPNLEELRINIDAEASVSADGLVELIRDLKNLQKCDVTPDATRLDLDLLRRFIEAKKQGNPQPLKIYWGGDIDEDLLKSPLYLDNLDIVEFRRGEFPYRHRWRKNKLFLFK
ncbi:uncharacterized protein LOC119647840 [Hermetia illucens]|uniref:uncharacterized protein LOC119647840 n=1 Tax=Hermetia illucens TaxID=343691 RepID=UPI0018CC4E62|nr:uncharacterized protein LOC119647840 [Hermetia illucens]XP_037905021.1 uncharacterized protein LOC119647840 [Hermetia illucens]XP_037905022.1 uncharacterized protein LOC119647840 [Hermetia illucens]